MGAAGAAVAKLGLNLCKRVPRLRSCVAGSPKHVRMDPLGKIGLLRQSLKTVPDVSRPARPFVFTGGAKRGSVTQPQLLAMENPCLKIRLNTVWQDREIIYSTFTVTNSHFVLTPVKVSREKIAEFSSSKTSLPEHHDDGFVSGPQSSTTTGNQKFFNLFGGQDLLGGRRSSVFHRVMVIL